MKSSAGQRAKDRFGSPQYRIYQSFYLSKIPNDNKPNFNEEIIYA
jgi:hypothetical protein